MERLRSDLTEYLDCLGMGEFSYRPLATNSAPESGSPAWSVDPRWTPLSEILVIAEPGSPAEEDLLEKMLQAIQLGPVQCQRILLAAGGRGIPHDLEQYLGARPTGRILWMHADRSGIAAPAPVWAPAGQKWVLTHSPRECLENPGLKKVVWEDLKTFKAAL
jgi:hypothetical protein